MGNIKITKEIHNELVDTFDARVKNFELKGKNLIALQTEFFAGAIRVLDIVNGGNQSCITPLLYFSLLRGERVRKITDEGTPPILNKIPPM